MCTCWLQLLLTFKENVSVDTVVCSSRSLVELAEGGDRVMMALIKQWGAAECGEGWGNTKLGSTAVACSIVRMTHQPQEALK
jgi:hypothetical protein